MVAEVPAIPVVSPPIQYGGNDRNIDIDSLKLDLRTQLDQRHCYHQQDVYSDSSETSDDDGSKRELAINNNAFSMLSGGGEESNGPNVFVSDSTGIHVGTKNYYQGPVTIKKIVYAGTSEIPDGSGVQNGIALTNEGCDMGKDKAAGNVNSAIGDNKLEKPAAHCMGNSFNIHIAKLRFNTPLLITLFVCTLVIIGLMTLLIVFLKGNSTLVYSPDSDEQLQRPPSTNDTQNDPNDLPTNRVKVITRREWLAQDPSGPTDSLQLPVPNVIVWHTATENCTTQTSCAFSVKNIQVFHIQAQKWYDIAYNFLVGGDGYVYEGRGWFTEGSHTKFYNRYSIGIGFIGTFTKYMPSKRQMIAAKNLIAWGVNESYIQPNYKLFGARQLSSTESPGDMLQKELQTWPHWFSGTP